MGAHEALKLFANKTIAPRTCCLATRYLPLPPSSQARSAAAAATASRVTSAVLVRSLAASTPPACASAFRPSPAKVGGSLNRPPLAHPLGAGKGAVAIPLGLEVATFSAEPSTATAPSGARAASEAGSSSAEAARTQRGGRGSAGDPNRKASGRSERCVGSRWAGPAAAGGEGDDGSDADGRANTGS